MPISIEEIARKAKAELDSDVNLQIVGEWCSQKVSELYAKTKYKALRKLGELELLGAINAGTVTTTIGSNQVTGDATASPAWSNLQEGWFFRTYPLKTWYRIAKVDTGAGVSTLTLENLFATEDNVSSPVGTVLTGQTYFIVQRFVPAATDARFFGTFVLDRMYLPIAWKDPNRMQEIYPSRFLVGPYPWSVSEFQGNQKITAFPKMLEFYPYPLQNEVVHYVYWSHPPVIEFTENIPATLDEYVIREMVMIPIMRYEMARAARKGEVEQASFWRNEMRTQQTKERDLIDEAIRSDAGQDDLTFMVARTRNRAIRANDFDPIQSAEADVWSRRG